MEITLEWLKEKSACQESRDRFKVKLLNEQGDYEIERVMRSLNGWPGNQGTSTASSGSEIPVKQCAYDSRERPAT